MKKMKMLIGCLVGLMMIFVIGVFTVEASGWHMGPPTTGGFTLVGSGRDFSVTVNAGEIILISNDNDPKWRSNCQLEEGHVFVVSGAVYTVPWTQTECPHDPPNGEVRWLHTTTGGGSISFSNRQDSGTGEVWWRAADEPAPTVTSSPNETQQPTESPTVIPALTETPTHTETPMPPTQTPTPTTPTPTTPTPLPVWQPHADFCLIEGVELSDSLVYYIWETTPSNQVVHHKKEGWEIFGLDWNYSGPILVLGVVFEEGKSEVVGQHLLFKEGNICSPENKQLPEVPLWVANTGVQIQASDGRKTDGYLYWPRKNARLRIYEVKPDNGLIDPKDWTAGRFNDDLYVHLSTWPDLLSIMPGDGFVIDGESWQVYFVLPLVPNEYVSKLVERGSYIVACTDLSGTYNILIRIVPVNSA